ESAGRPWKPWRDVARRRRRLRGGPGAVRRCRHRRGCPRRPAPGRGREGIRQLLEGAHGRDRREERHPGQGQLSFRMRVLVVDVGGTHVKVLVTGEKTHRELASGPTLTAAQMVAGVTTLVADWKYDAVSIGYPGPVLDGRPVAEPHNLGRGWVGFDFQTAFG